MKSNKCLNFTVNICNLRIQTQQFMNAIPKTYRTFNHSEEKSSFAVHTAYGTETSTTPDELMMMKMRYAQVLNIIFKDHFKQQMKIKTK